MCSRRTPHWKTPLGSSLAVDYGFLLNPPEFLIPQLGPNNTLGPPAIIRLQRSINKLLVEAFAEESKSKLLQAVLLEPTVTSYRGAVEMVDEMLGLQREILPPIH